MNIKSNFKKIIILVLVTILISSNTLHAAKFKWTKIIASVDDDEFYLDKNSIYKVGSYHYYWSLINVLKDPDKDPSNITFNIVNCDTYENKTVTYAGYFKNMGKGPVDLEIIIPDADLEYFKWQKFGAGTSMNKLLKEVCKIR